MAEQTGAMADERTRSAERRPLLLRVGVVGAAVAGAVALIIVTGPVRPEVYTGGGVAVLVAAAAYLFWPRWGTIALLSLGTIICVACAVGYSRIGAVPWLLTSFWAGAAVLLAGLLDLIGRDAKEPMAGVSVAAVLSLLLLSALGLGQYVRVNWPLTGRAMLESIPQDVTRVAEPSSTEAPMSVEQAPGGRWVGRWIVHTRDRNRAWSALALAIQNDGWRVRANRVCERLTAVKDGYELVVVETGPDAASAETTAAAQDDLSLAAYVSASPR